MRILRVHNRYQQPGGEDAVFLAESALLRSNGHDVEAMEFSNDEIGENPGLPASARLALTTIWSKPARMTIRDTVAMFRPDVVHFDNTFPLVSPAAYAVVRRAGIPVVQTFHNYRLLCPSATFFRDGAVCEDCLHKTPPLPGVVHGCYRGSRLQSGVVAAMLTTHRLRQTWSRDVDTFIALTPFAKGKFVEGGLPAERIVVKPNFVDRAWQPRTGDASGFLFVGRLSTEKGIGTLLASLGQLPERAKIQVAGDGPLDQNVRDAAGHHPHLEVLGRLDRSGVDQRMRSATALVFPSTWYEGFPLTIIEAFSNGLPVIASRLGSMAGIIEDHVTGLLFEAGNPDDLAAKVSWAHAHPDEMKRMGENARREYESKYTPQRIYNQLMTIYEDAIHRVSGKA